MKKYFIIQSLVLAFSIMYGSYSVNAQEETKHERLESARVAFITQRVDLKPDQAQKFWPVYNEFSDKRKEIKKALRKLRTGDIPADVSEEELKADIRKMMDYKQKELNLEKEYFDKFLTVISAKQVVQLIKAEKDFMVAIYKRLAEKDKQ